MIPQAIIAGIDEAGRGALAGPVVAGACILPFPLHRLGRKNFHWSPSKRESPGSCIIADSKQLTPEQRERAFQWIVATCACGIGIVPHSVIDASGILAATELAMQRALLNLSRTLAPTFLLVDGRDHFWFDLPHSSVIRGDALEPCIAAASILAKVTRDRLMRMHGRLSAAYGFAEHKGYGSQDHIDALRAHGPSPFHRLTFLTRILPPTQHSTELLGTKNQMPTAKRKSGTV